MFQIISILFYMKGVHSAPCHIFWLFYIVDLWMFALALATLMYLVYWRVIEFLKNIKLLNEL